ncbi:MAG: oxygen-independent coproporphyrinogen III oxidase [Candidatus Eisenbacteria bacterium]
MIEETTPRRVTAELLRRYDRPGPRYTSYPTAVEFHERFDSAAYERKLAEADARSGEPLSLYFHLPFCHERCTFCGCNVIITHKHEITRRYLEYLKKETALVASRLPHRRLVNQVHWGGGTPTYQTSEEMRDLMSEIRRHFTIAPEAEIAIEVDPRVTSREQIDTLRDIGFGRLSMGVQDFTPEVQAAIARNQSLEQTVELYEYCRGIGFSSINVDLIYGLPMQTVATFRKNLEQVVAMRPDRVAVYSFAFVPWIRGNQKKTDPATLPPPEVKFELFLQALEAFTAAGYRQIGMDHFALPEDELSIAQAEGRLYRNFMGYTVMPAADQVGIGISSIGNVRHAFAQNVKKLSTYYPALDEGRLPIEKGYELSVDDRIRQVVIASLMCNFEVRLAGIEERFGIDFRAYFARELEELKVPEEHGFVEVEADRVRVTQTGRLFVRNVCMLFDAYLAAKQASGQPVFSRTV